MKQKELGRDSARLSDLIDPVGTDAESFCHRRESRRGRVTAPQPPSSSARIVFASFPDSHREN